MYSCFKSCQITTVVLLLWLAIPLSVVETVVSALEVSAQTPMPSDKRGEAELLSDKGLQEFRSGQLREAIETYQQVLVIYRAINEQVGEADTLSTIGAIYRELEQYPQAIEFYQKALLIRRKIDDYAAEALTLNILGQLYSNLGEYSQSLKSYQQALVIFQSTRDRLNEARVLNNIGESYRRLGQYSQALEFYQEGLATFQAIGYKLGQGTILNNIGAVYVRLGQFSKGLDFYQQALEIARTFKNPSGQGRALSNIATVYLEQGQYSQALELYQQALEIRRVIGDREGEGEILNNVGLVYDAIGQYFQALQCYQQALAIEVDIGDRAGERITLANIGFLLQKQNQPELAIVFYKQSVNVTESIRQNLRALPQEQQQSYTETVADTYRHLANLLLKQDRILEAQRVLDLLKVQELEDYLRDVRGNTNTAQGAPNLPPEQQIADGYEAILDKAIELGKELTQLRQLKPENRIPQQEQRIAQLEKAQEQIIAEFNTFIESPEVLVLIDQLSPSTRKPDLVDDLEDLIGLQDNLRSLEQNAVLLYPLILEARLELVLMTPDSPPIRRSVQVTKEQLNQAIVTFRRALQDFTSNAKTPARQLYDWLIKPLEADLKAAEAQTLIYAPDGQLRYIPLAALHDGEQWLVQRYRINNITAASLTDLNTQPQPQLQVLAGAFTTGHYSFDIGGQQFNFAGLPFARLEVETLAQTIPTTTQLLDQAFNPADTIPKMDDYTVVHLATHGAFVVGQPQDSFILFGNGERVTLEEVKKWNFKNVDLVVLSACETGVGGNLGSGEEILGFGYLMQRAGARAAIASLWTVDDASTQLLMNAFYAALQNGSITKAEALRQAQIALITGNDRLLGGQRGIVVMQRRLRHELKPEVANRLGHPYYWAPFILIGNGL